MTGPAVTVLTGDAAQILATLPDASVDSIVTDPPAGVAFMGKTWDKDKGGRDAWIAWLTEIMTEARRVLKPGGHALVWALPRTAHWTATALEDAGFEIRDCVVHLFGSGFPKGQDVGKAIDRARDDGTDIRRVTAWLARARNVAGWTNRQLDEAFGTNGMAGHWTSVRSQPAVPTWAQWERLRELLVFGAEMDAEVWRLNGRKGTPGEAWDQREVLATIPDRWAGKGAVLQRATQEGREEARVTAPATPDAMRWDGWNTALKPGHEQWWLVRKPFRGTVAANVVAHGTGALNVDGCRVPCAPRPVLARTATVVAATSMAGTSTGATSTGELTTQGRWPANLVITHSAGCDEAGACADDCPAGELDAQSGITTPKPYEPNGKNKVYRSGKGGGGERKSTGGRWPANLVITHSAGCDETGACADDCPAGELDAQSGITASVRSSRGEFHGRIYGNGAGASGPDTVRGHADAGGASRFYPVFRYQAKAPRSERPTVDGINHPTVKSLTLMRWLVRLITPPGGTVLDMFAGSGATLEAARLEGFGAIGVEADPDYVRLINARLNLEES